MTGRGLSTLFGIVLILMGIWMLADRLGLQTPEWGQVYPLALVLLGAGFLARFFGGGSRPDVFLGSVLTLAGLFFILRNYGIVPYLYPDEYWPLLLAILGLGFVFESLVQPFAAGPLIPGGLLLLFGLAWFGQTMGYWRWEQIMRYWPAVLIVVGLSLIAHSLIHRA